MRHCVRRQRLWGQNGDLSNRGVLSHCNLKESEDEPKNLAPHPSACQPKNRLMPCADLLACTSGQISGSAGVESDIVLTQ
jgi:hypothetical protein